MIIGIVGPRASAEKIKLDLVAIDPSIEARIFSREKSREAMEVIEGCENQCDATIFTGCGPYYSVIREFAQDYKMRKPYDYISKSGASLSKVFYDMQKAGIAIDDFSIDVAEADIIEDTMMELDIHPHGIFVRPFVTANEEEYIQWHLDLWKQGKIKAMLTGFVVVHDYLIEQGYPSFYLPPTRSMVRITLDKLKSDLALQEAHYSQLAVETFRLRVNSETAENYYANMLKKSEAEGLMINYVAEIQGTLFPSGRNEYMIYASKGCVKSEENYGLLYELQRKIKEKGFLLNVGLGLGLTAYQSDSNARKALLISMEDKDDTIYLVDENDRRMGPLGKAQVLEYEIASSDPRVLEIAEKTELSAVAISRLMSMIEIRKNPVFDAGALADCLYISTRSARRILNKLMEQGYARVYAKESSGGSGRPKRLVEIRF